MFSLANRFLVTNHVLLAAMWFTTCWSLTYSMRAQLKGLIHNFIWGVVIRGTKIKWDIFICYNAWVTFLGYNKRQGYKIIMHGKATIILLDAKDGWCQIWFYLSVWYKWKLSKDVLGLYPRNPSSTSFVPEDYSTD